MALTAREWLLLPEKEQKRRNDELSPQECFLLRTQLAYVHFTEEEKRAMSKDQKEQFIHPEKYTEGKKRVLNKCADDIFNRLCEEAENGKR